VRVVAGRFGGRRLSAPPGRGTRPTSDRVREALFSILGPLDGERVLDLYAGSGALAIEALSRGAGSALLVERDPRAVAVIRANLEALGSPNPRRRCTPAPPVQPCETHPSAETHTIWCSWTPLTGALRSWGGSSPRRSARCLPAAVAW